MNTQAQTKHSHTITFAILGPVFVTLGILGVVLHNWQVTVAAAIGLTNAITIAVLTCRTTNGRTDASEAHS